MRPVVSGSPFVPLMNYVQLTIMDILKNTLKEIYFLNLKFKTQNNGNGKASFLDFDIEVVGPIFTTKNSKRDTTNSYLKQLE